MDSTDDLAAVVPPTRKLILSGREYTLCPVLLGQLPCVLAALRPVFKALGDQPVAADPITVVLEMLFEHPDVLVSVLQAATGLERALVEAANMSQAVDMFVAVIELNVDFFSTAVAPKLGVLLATIGAATATATTHGPTPSSA